MANLFINCLKYLTFSKTPTIITIISSYFNVLELSRVDALPAPDRRYDLLSGATVLGQQPSKEHTPLEIS